jgi:hypothetical protein
MKDNVPTLPYSKVKVIMKLFRWSGCLPVLKYVCLSAISGRGLFREYFCNYLLADVQWCNGLDKV